MLAAPRVVLWSLSMSYLDECRQHDPSLPGSEEILWYVDNGYIQINAREWWLRNTERRQKHPWTHTRTWTGFDAAIRERWEEDARLGRTRATARVLAAEDEEGWDWADGQLASGAFDVDKLNAQAVDLLPGYREKAARLGGHREAARSLLRDAKNHGDVFRFSHADRNYGSPADEMLATIILTNVRHDSVSSVPYLRTSSQIERLVTAIHATLERLGDAVPRASTSDEAFDRTKTLLSNEEELQRLRYWVTDCDMLAGHLGEDDLAGEIAHRLFRAIEQHSPKYRLLDYFIPRSPIQTIATIGGLGLGICGLMIGSPLAPISLVMLGLRPAEVTFKKLGLMREDYTGERWPLYVADKDGAPRRHTREAVLHALQK